MSLVSRPIKAGDHVFLVDGSSFVFRAYFQSIRQDPKYNYRSDKLPTGAVRLFCAKLFQFIREGAGGIAPTHLAIIFDKSENSFRKEIFPAYKANRNEPPEDLVPQFPLMRCAVRAFGLEPVEQDTYEADDLIATYAREARDKGADVLIISADKDLMQLIEPGVSMYDPASGDPARAGSRAERMIGMQEVIDHFGVTPDKVIDVQALAGDSTDNVPGAPGIGLKTAAQLLTEYGDLDTLLAKAGSIKQQKRRETLTDPDKVDLIRISKQLVTLVRDVPLEIPLDQLGLHQPDPRQLVAFLKALEFTTLSRRAAESYGLDIGGVDADSNFVGSLGWRTRNGSHQDGDFPVVAPPPRVPTPKSAAAGTVALGPGALAAMRIAEARGVAIGRDRYTAVTTLEALDAVIAAAQEAGVLALSIETTLPDPMRAELVGLALATAPGCACYLPFGHVGKGEGELFGDGASLPGQLDVRAALERLAPVFTSPAVLKIGHNLKGDLTVLDRHGARVSTVDDTMLMSYALDSGKEEGHGLDTLARRHLGHQPIVFKDLAGSGRNALALARLSIEQTTPYGAEKADLMLHLWRLFKARLPADRVATVYETLERPLLEVLARMERRGIRIDKTILSRLSGDFTQSMARLEAEIYEQAGQSFNLGSPKQVGDILFGKMGLSGAQKTATGAWSTSARVLDDLAEGGNPFARLILDWRQVSKLKQTYTDALPAHADPGTDRVHTSYQLASTTTGRLSSTEPNLQNIPVRTEAGRKIRTAFIPAPGHRLVSADYSQIELRLLAHIADLPQLKQAFAEGLDIHAMTASEMFGVPVAGMPGEVRRRAKAINFGIIYGISAFGLANQLSISREEAGAYIRTYFERFPGIRDYMDATKKRARADGYVTTLFGRRCHYPRIAASNPSERAFNERAAINAPIQGSAADIIRRAMVRMDAALAQAKLEARMLLQVHDELVFEVPDDEVEATLPLVRQVMVDAPHPAVALSVPLQVDARAAGNWDEAH